MLRLAIVVWGMMCACAALAQENSVLPVKVVNLQKLPLEHASVELLKPDSSLIKILLTDSTGTVEFTNAVLPAYLLHISFGNYHDFFSLVQNDGEPKIVTLQPRDKPLEAIVVKTHKPFLELHPTKTVVNLDAGITNVGTTILETLEKLPGVSVDRNGNISLKGRQGVTVLFDGKLTYLSGEELATLLQGLNASQVSQIELMNIPPASLDAAGNAGVINLKFKKGNLFGLNGSFTANVGQGKYARTNDQLSLNYRSGRMNYFINYSLNASEGFQRADALRTYFKNDGTSSLLDQYNFVSLDDHSHNVRTGIDYTLGKATSLNLSFSGVFFKRISMGQNESYWKKSSWLVDSIIRTQSHLSSNRRNAGATASFRHSFTAAKELSADVDLLGYKLTGNQFLEIATVSPVRPTDAYRADIPSDLRIFSAKADYTEQIKNGQFGFGWKSSNVNTDNVSAYEYWTTVGWKPDANKSNHFFYNETIHAMYGTAQTKQGKFLLDGGLRFETTSYDARQVVKDSSFSVSTIASFLPLLFRFKKIRQTFFR